MAIIVVETELAEKPITEMQILGMIVDVTETATEIESVIEIVIEAVVAAIGIEKCQECYPHHGLGETIPVAVKKNNFS